MRDERTPAGPGEEVKLEEVLQLANSIALGHYSQVFAEQLSMIQVHLNRVVDEISQSFR